MWFRSFLLAAARRLGKELTQLRAGEDEPAPEAIQIGVRDVITYCIYSVDQNSLAVKLCRVALGLEGHVRDRPLTFLEQHIRHGNSLVGLIDLTILKDGIPEEAYRSLGGTNRARMSEARKRNACEWRGTSFRYGFVGRLLDEMRRVIRQIVAIPETTIEAQITSRGLTRSCLQVPANNTAAQHFYRQCGYNEI